MSLTYLDAISRPGRVTMHTDAAVCSANTKNFPPPVRAMCAISDMRP